MTEKKIYLAIPYSGLCELSYEISIEVTKKVMTEGHIVFSPIVHSHPLKGLPQTWEFWAKQDLQFVDWADEVWVVVIGKTGWELIDKSVGVKAEMDHAHKTGKYINYVVYDGELIKETV